MKESTNHGTSPGGDRTWPVPTGGVTLDGERLKLAAGPWESVHRLLRGLDELKIGETEPATLFVWRSGEP
ncbi:MAG: hypothetical protein AB1641_19025 [Thermodesulfobacteriota bacterium]